MTGYTIRDATADHIEWIKEIAVAADMFNVDEVEFFDEMVHGALDGTLEGHYWLVVETDAGSIVMKKHESAGSTGQTTTRSCSGRPLPENTTLNRSSECSGREVTTPLVPGQLDRAGVGDRPHITGAPYTAASPKRTDRTRPERDTR